MPYENERANVYGYRELYDNPMVRERLKTYAYRNTAEPKIAEGMKIRPSAELKVGKYYTPFDLMKKLVAVDGSVTDFSEPDSFQLGFLKVGSVTQDLDITRGLSDTVFIDHEDVGNQYRTETVSALVPGRGVLDRKAVLNRKERTWKNKFRMEMFVAFREMVVNGLDEKNPKTLLETLFSLFAPYGNTMKCFDCSKQILVLESLAMYCDGCGSPCYFTDQLFTNVMLDFYDRKSSESNSNNVLSAMSIVERVLMTALIDSADDDVRSTTAFITDGSLAHFSPDPKFIRSILRFLQSDTNGRRFPFLFGLEKHGKLNEVAELDWVRNSVGVGDFMMVTNDMQEYYYGYSENRKEYFYGKRFLYRSLEDLFFVVMVPPIVGVPYVEDWKDRVKTDDWGRYPTLGTIAEILDNASAKEFGLDVPALSVVAKANHVSSLPKKLSEQVLRELAENIELVE